jgi:carbon-monoxide dehydrogenase large subunit
MWPIVRSPHAHARIVAIDDRGGEEAPGVIAVVTGAELAKVITPWVGVLTHLKGIKSAPQYAIAVERALLAGRGGVRRGGEDARPGRGCVRAGRGDIRGSSAVTDAETALDAGTPVIHPELGDNLTFERKHEAGEPGQGLRRGRRSRRGDVPVRPPHRRVQRAARDHRPTGIRPSSA